MFFSCSWASIENTLLSRTLDLLIVSIPKERGRGWPCGSDCPAWLQSGESAKKKVAMTTTIEETVTTTTITTMLMMTAVRPCFRRLRPCQRASELMSSSRTHFFLRKYTLTNTQYTRKHTHTNIHRHTHTYALWFARTFCEKFLQRFGLKFFCVFTTEFSPYNLSLSVSPVILPPLPPQSIPPYFVLFSFICLLHVESIINTHKRPVELTFKHAHNFFQALLIRRIGRG